MNRVWAQRKCHFTQYMLYTGLTSVTFRKLSSTEVIELARENSLTGIEWGGDIHVPAGGIEEALRVAEATRIAGLRVAAFGSYFRLGSRWDFMPVLETALALGAPTIRIWAGDRGSDDVGSPEFNAIVGELREVADHAAARGLTVSLELHHGTIADSVARARLLLGRAGHPALRSYWQILPGSDEKELGPGIEALRPWLSNVHVFHWDWLTCPPRRRALAEAFGTWSRLLHPLATSDAEHGALLEFVRDDSPDALREDAAELNAIVRAARESKPVL